MLNLLIMVQFVVLWSFVPTVMPSGKPFRSFKIQTFRLKEEVLSFLFLQRDAEISEPFVFLLSVQDYLNVKFKETGHSNMYFPQVCFVGLFFSLYWTVECYKRRAVIELSDCGLGLLRSL